MGWKVEKMTCIARICTVLSLLCWDLNDYIAQDTSSWPQDLNMEPRQQGLDGGVSGKRPMPIVNFFNV